MQLKPGYWVLLLNDMRMAHAEQLVPVACAETRDELERFIESEKVETYQTDNEGRRPGIPPTIEGVIDDGLGPAAVVISDLGSTHGTNATWSKSFRQGGPLEWFNPPWSDENFIQWFPPPEPPPPELPHIRELTGA